MPLGDGNERSQKTRLGKALGRMRDRIFHVGPTALRIASAGIRHQAQQWQLVHEGEPRQQGNVAFRTINLPLHVPSQKAKPFNGIGKVGNVGNVLPPLWTIWRETTHD